MVSLNRKIDGYKLFIRKRETSPYRQEHQRPDVHAQRGNKTYLKIDLISHETLYKHKDVTDNQEKVIKWFIIEHEQEFLSKLK